MPQVPQGSSTVKMDREQLLQEAGQFLPRPRPAEVGPGNPVKITAPMTIEAQPGRSEATPEALPAAGLAPDRTVVQAQRAVAIPVAPQANIAPAPDPAKPALEAQIAKLYRVVLFLIVLVVIALIAIAVMALTRNS